MERLLERKLRRYCKSTTASEWRWGFLKYVFVDAVKYIFDGNEDVLMTNPRATGLGDLDDLDIRLGDGFLYVPVEEMRADVFELVVSNVFKLIQNQPQQLGGTCFALVMFGEFGSSWCLSKRVREEFAHRVGLIVIPQRPDLAVVRGVVYMGLDNKAI